MPVEHNFLFRGTFIEPSIMSVYSEIGQALDDEGRPMGRPS